MSTTAATSPTPFVPAERKQGSIAMRRVSHRREIYPVFRELFRRDGVEDEAVAP